MGFTSALLCVSLNSRDGCAIISMLVSPGFGKECEQVRQTTLVVSPVSTAEHERSFSSDHDGATREDKVKSGALPSFPGR